MSVNIIITTAGRAAIINAQNTGTAPVTITQVGLSATAVTPAVGNTVLAGEFKRISGVGGSVVAADTIHINALDDSTDAYTVRSFALYLASGTLFAIYGQADPLIVKTAGSAAGLAIDTIFADINAASLTFGNTNFLNPPATTTTAGVARLTTLAEAAAGTSALLALTPVAAKAAVLGWLLTMDGAGSGLDADLLDGQDGAYYADVAGRLGFTPVNKAGDSMTGALTLPGDPTAAKHATTCEWVIAQISSGALGFTPVNKAGDTMTGLLTLHADPTAVKHAVTKQYLDALVTADAIRTKLLTVDGAGSGIDADLLDGLDASAFVRSVDTGSYGENANGFWEKRPNGVIEQWGSTPIASGGSSVTGTITFPIPFPTACKGIIGVANDRGNSGWGPLIVMTQHALVTNTNCPFVADTANGSQFIASGRAVLWRAIGL